MSCATCPATTVMQKCTCFPAAILLIALAGAALLSLYAVKAPDPVPVDAPAHLFSAGRAMSDVRKIAQSPHAMGTVAHARVRAYLVARQQAWGCSRRCRKRPLPPLRWGPLRRPGTCTTCWVGCRAAARAKQSW
jgi:hypothetical protein